MSEACRKPRRRECAYTEARGRAGVHFATPPHLTLIMDKVRYMDSTGVGVIIAIIQQMRRRGGKLEILGLSDVGRQLLQILRVTALADYVSVIG